MNFARYYTETEQHPQTGQGQQTASGGETDRLEVERVDFPVDAPGPKQSPKLEVVERPALTPVVVASQEVWNSSALKRSLPQREGFLLVEGFQPPEQLLAHCQRLAPCVLIADAALLNNIDPGDFSGVVDFGRSIQVLVYGAGQDERTLQNLVRMGCMGFVAEGASPALVKKAVRALARGEMWIERRLLTRVLQQLLFATRSPKLTPREKDILRLIARGYKNRAIAERLSISHETVRWHIRSLHAKLGLQDRLGTALYAQQYLEAESPGSQEAGTAHPPLPRVIPRKT